MNYEGLNLVAVVDELSDEPKARPVADVVMFRVDTADEPIKQLQAYDGELPIIATTKPKDCNTTRMTKQEVELLLSAIEEDPVKAASVDIDSIEEERLSTALEQADIDVFVSYHNFDQTPEFETLMATVTKAAEYGDVVTLAPTAETMDDALTFLSVVAEATSQGITIGGASMGEVGRHTRIVAPAYGSKFAFAPLTTESPNSISGQFSLERLAELIEQMDDPETTVSLHESITNSLVRKERSH